MRAIRLGPSASNVWTVGFSGSTQARHALAEHWNGRTWKRVSTPDPAGSGTLLGVAATSAPNAWAVSGAAGHEIGTSKTVIDRWKRPDLAAGVQPEPQARRSHP